MWKFTIKGSDRESLDRSSGDELGDDRSQVGSADWSVGKLDVEGAFMYAPLPEGLIVVVRPPKIWETLGLVPPGTLWTLQRAV